MIEQIQTNGIFCTHMVDFCRSGHYVIYTIRRAVALVKATCLLHYELCLTGQTEYRAVESNFLVVRSSSHWAMCIENLEW